MLIKWRSYNKARKGAIRLQAVARGHNIRRVYASIAAQKYYRRFVARKRFLLLKSAVISLQCRTRERVAKKIMFDLKKEQKDVGKLKQNNEKLKQEMASLRAMLAAQAKQGAADDAHAKELAVKEKQIADLEKRIAEIEKELEAAKALVEKLEVEAKKQQEESAQDKETIKKLQNRRPGAITSRSGSLEAPLSPGGRRRRNISGDSGSGSALLPPPPGVASDYVSPEVLAEHRAKVAILEEELDAERRFRREADGEIIKLRAKISGVELNDADVDDLLSQRIDTPMTISAASSIAEESTKLRYIFFTLVALVLEVFGTVFLLRRRAFLRVCLLLLGGMGNDFITVNENNSTFGLGEFLPDEMLITHHGMEVFYSSSFEAF
jgi:hypothetical protein